MDHDINRTFMFTTNPWPTLPELVPSNNSDILLKYLASYHAASTGQQQTQANAAVKDIVYPWMRDTAVLNAASKRNSPYHLQSGSLMSSNNQYGAGINQLSLASPISPQHTPPTSLSPGKLQ
jgi:hypothetical protein